MITARDELMVEIATDFNIKDGGNGKLEFTGMKSTNDEERKKEKRLYRLKIF